LNSARSSLGQRLGQHEVLDHRSVIRLVGARVFGSLGADVDVVTEASRSPYMRDRIFAEAVALGGD